MPLAIKKQIAIDWVRDHKDLPNRTSARMLHEKHPGVFANMNAARMMIVKIRSNKTKKNSVTCVPELARSPEEIDSWRNKLPRAEPTGFEIYRTPTMVDIRYLVLGDAHFPYQDNSAIELAIETGIGAKCNGIIMVGDMLDHYSLSRFVRDPRKRNMQYEIDCMNKFLETLKKVFKPVKFIWKLGNHEDRLEKYLMARAPELIGLKVLKTRSVYALGENIDIVPANNPIRHKALTILHGHEYGSGFIPPVNPARGIFLKTNACTLMAHRHTTSEHTETTVEGKTITCWSLGCLCNLHPEYAPLNKWNHGFGILETSSRGEFWKFKNYRIVKGVVV